MRRIAQGLLLTAALAVLPAAVALAQAIDDTPLPQVNVMTCDAACLNYTLPKNIQHDLPKFPRSVDGPFHPYAEGFIWLRYTIGKDGKVLDVAPIYNVGPQAFADKTIETVKGWTFEPAKIDGKPVEKSIDLNLSYSASTGPGAGFDLNAIYTVTRALRDAGKNDEARAKLEADFAQPQISLRERSAIALPLAQLAVERNDYLEAKRILLLGTIKPGYIIPTTAPALWRLRGTVDLYLGEVADAISSAYWLARLPGPEGAAFSKFLDAARTKTNAMPELVVQARIPDGPEGNVYWHILYRRTFAFQAEAGVLDHFVLSCAESRLESKITLTAQWHVPANWSNCRIDVYGKPGAGFRLVETNDSKADLDAQMAQYDDAVKADPNNASVFLKRAHAYLTRDRDNDALANLDKAITLDPASVDAHMARAGLRITQADQDGAIADDNAVLKIAAKNQNALFSRAFVYRMQGRYEEALADYNTLIDLKNVSAYFNRGVVEMCLGHYIDAEFDFRKHLSLTGEYLLDDIWLHVIHAHRGVDDDRGTGAYLARLPDTAWMRRIADLQMNGLALDKVAAEYDAWRKNPTDKSYWSCEAQFFIAEYQLEHGDAKDARERFATVTPKACPWAASAVAGAELKQLVDK